MIARKGLLYMKYNPRTKKLYTDNMIFIKQLSCPYNINWDMLPKNNDIAKRFCSLCQDYVYDTNEFSDVEVLQMVKNKQDTCLKLSYTQKNMEIGLHGG